MRKSLFNKARKHEIQKDYESEDSIYFKCEGYEQRLWYENGILKFNCTCKYGSTKVATYMTPCSHIIRAIYHLTKYNDLTTIKKLKEIFKPEKFNELMDFLRGQTIGINEKGETYVYEDDLFRFINKLPVID